MFCKNCGRENEEGNTFCAFCGSAMTGPAMPAPPVAPVKPPKAPNPPKAPKQKKGKPNVMAWVMSAVAVVLAVLLVLSFVGVLGGGGGTGGSSGGGSVVAASKSFGSPEEAIEYFVDRMKAGDFDGAMQACAAGELAANFDYEAYVERIRTVPSIAIAGLPSEYDAYRSYNAYYFASQVGRQAMGFYLSMFLPEEFQPILDYQQIPDQDGELARDAVDAFKPANLSGLEIVEIKEHDRADDERNRENQKKMAKTYGADDYLTMSVLYRFDGDYYIGGFTLIEYSGGWQIFAIFDPMSGTMPSGALEMLDDEDDFDDRLE